MPNRLHDIHLVVSFKEPIQLHNPIETKWKFPNSSDDRIIITGTEVNIHYRRSANSSAAKAVNKTRIDYLQLIALILACLDRTEQAPIYNTAYCSIDEKDGKYIDLPNGLIDLKLVYSGITIPRHVAVRSFGEDELAKSLRISISYCWAASQAYAQEERLKLLWGSFNALYRWYFHVKSTDRATEVNMLDAINTLFVENEIFNRADRVFKSQIEPIYKDFIRWKVVTGKNSKSVCIFKESEREKKRTRLCMMDRETLIYMRDYGCNTVSSKQLLKDEINQVISNACVDKCATRKIAMLVCRYIYIFRCSSMHADIMYPVFKTEKEEEKRILANLLEAVVVDLAEWLSKEHLV